MRTFHFNLRTLHFWKMKRSTHHASFPEMRINSSVFCLLANRRCRAFIGRFVFPSACSKLSSSIPVRYLDALSTQERCHGTDTFEKYFLYTSFRSIKMTFRNPCVNFSIYDCIPSPRGMHHFPFIFSCLVKENLYFLIRSILTSPSRIAYPKMTRQIL